jgi:hypothetical protein
MTNESNILITQINGLNLVTVSSPSSLPPVCARCNLQCCAVAAIRGINLSVTVRM